MKIGMIVDGQGEFRSLKNIIVRIRTNANLLNPLYADLQPRANTGKLVRAAMPSVRVLAGRDVERILIILDHEYRPECVPEWRDSLEDALRAPCRQAGIDDVKVVLKVQMYENWLVSDPNTIKSMRSRFTLSRANERKIVPDRADRADALNILKAAAQGPAYHKVQDAVAIMARFDLYAGAENSRSLRRFLRLAGCRTYSGQSRISA